MVNKKENNEFVPTIAIPPGETIRENMDFLGMNQKELATRLGITEKHLSNILNGNASITYETALKLELVIGPSAQFWMNLETHYQLDKARLTKQDDINSDFKILNEIPYKKMSEHGWLENTKDRTQRVLNCRIFFGVANLSSIEPSYVARFKKHNHIKGISDLGILAWIRKAELDGLSVEVGKFSKSYLKKLIPTFRKLTLKDPAEFYPEMKKLCAKCGVVLELVEALPKTYICGATILKNDKAILALSVRGKRADIFWFTFFHELAHLIKHSDQELHINYEKETEECEADMLASNYLIPDKLYEKFIKEYDYKDKMSIIRYSKNIGIAACILVGRLLHDKLIKYTDYSDLRPSFEIVRSNTW